jgi:menaquinone-dependent protoporphyrinogen oxidase
MARILIVYASTHGQTAKIAGALADALRRLPAAVDVFDARTASCRPHDYDGIIVAASVHAGGYQKTIRRWAKSYASVLNSKQTAFVSVCLAVLQHDPKVRQELDAIVTRFTGDVGWTPTVVKFVAGALLYTRYNWFVRRLMKRIVAKAGGDTDTTRDYEYTDWKDLRDFAERFGRRITAAAPTSTATAVVA